MARSVYDLPLGTVVQFSGRFQDQTAYQADVHSTALSGPAYAGLTDRDIKRLSVQVRWRDVTGARLAQAASILARVPK